MAWSAAIERHLQGLGGNYDPLDPGQHSLWAGGSASAMNNRAMGYARKLSDYLEKPFYDQLEHRVDNLDLVNPVRDRQQDNYATAKARSERQQSRYATNASLAAQDYSSSNMQRDIGLGNIHQLHQARGAQEGLKNQMEGVLLDYGNQKLQEGQNLTTQSYANWQNLENQRDALEKQQKSDRLANVIKVGAMAASVAIMFA